MKPLSPKPIFKLSYFSLKNIKYTHHFSFFSSTSVNNHPKAKETSSVRVSVWWDVENCSVPCNANVFRVAHSIITAVRAIGINGPVQITAFGDVMSIARSTQEALASTGITLSHVPNCGKNSADKSLIIDLMYWVSQNPPPAHIFLISGDRDFATILHRLRMNNYNVLLASRDCPPSVLCSAATITWRWCSLLKGENLSGRLFNQPPDGPYGSWYGKFRGSPEDPFTVNEQPLLLPLPKLASDSKQRKIPKRIVDHIRGILNSHPEGIPGFQIREEIKMFDSTFDKDYYGYRKLSSFLTAMPHVLEVIPGESGQFLVVASNSKLHADPVPDINVPNFDNGEVGVQSIPQPSSSNDVIEKSEEVPLPESKANSLAELLLDFAKEEKQGEPSSAVNVQALRVKAHATNLKGTPEEREKNESSRASNVKDTKKKYRMDVKKVRQEKKRKESLVETNVQDTQEQDKHAFLHDQQSKGKVLSFGVKEISEARDDSEAADKKPEIGFFKRIRTWFGLGDLNSSDIKISSRGDDIEEKNIPLSAYGESVPPLSVSPASDYVSNSCLESDTEVRYNSGEAGQAKDNSKQLKVFSKKAFWDELESFLNKPDDSALIFQSTTREQLAQNFKEQGPSSLRSLTKSNLLHLVDLLISDKKWVEELYSQNPPFRLRQSIVKEPSGDSTSSSNGLSLGERKRKNPAHTGVSQPVVHECHSTKTRSETLNDCQKLVNHITENYPEGFQLGCFRKLFIEQHGYPLDLQRLGYDKLVNLLHMMPGIKVESNLILPEGISNSRAATKSNGSDGEVVNSSKIEIFEEYLDRNSPGKDIDIDSSWEELGPVDDSGLKNDKTCAGFSSKLDLENKIANYESLAVDLEKKIPDFEPLPEDSGSDEETTVEADDGSLFDLLKMYDGSGEGKERISDSGNVDRSTDAAVHKTKSHLSGTRKQKTSAKNFTFVADHSAGAKDPMLGGILNTLNLKTEKKE